MDPIAVAEAAYTPAEDHSAWLRRVAEAARPMLDQGSGICALIHDVDDSGWISFPAVCPLGLPGAFFESLFGPTDWSTDDARFTRKIFRSALVSTSTQTVRRAPDGVRARINDLFGRLGLADMRYVNAVDPTPQAVALLVPTAHQRPWAPKAAHRWRLLAAHLAAGLRIQRCRAQASTAPKPEAILRPDGRMEHAEASAQGEPEREALRRGTLALDRARGPLRRRDADEALAIWEGLLEGRWSLVDHFDSDGRRYLLAHRNDPQAPDVRGLTLRERQVLGYAAAGHPNKLIAYELGLSPSTVAEHLTRAQAKLNLPSFSALCEFFTSQIRQSEGPTSMGSD